MDDVKSKRYQLKRSVGGKKEKAISSSQESYTMSYPSGPTTFKVSLYSQKTEGCRKMGSTKSCTATESCASRAL